MSGAIHPLPQYAFMAWCLVKAQGQLYLFFFLPLSVIEFHRNFAFHFMYKATVNIYHSICFTALGSSMRMITPFGAINEIRPSLEFNK
jgi:hypothetical protein